MCVAIVKDFDGYEYPQVVAALIKLASDEATYVLFNACVLELFTVKGCEEFKVIVTGKISHNSTFFDEWCCRISGSIHCVRDSY